MVAKGKGPRQRVCRLLNVPRSTSYYKSRARTVIVNEVLAHRIKHMIEAEPYLGYRMVDYAKQRRTEQDIFLAGLNRDTV